MLAVADGSVAQSLGIQKGDMVLKVNNATIATTADLQKAVSQPSRLWRVVIQRGAQQISLMVGG